jgi:hypothetical protein
MRKILAVLIVAVICASQFSGALAKSAPTYTISFELNGIYAPARIIVQFRYAQHVSGAVNVSTLSGRSLWTSQVSPVGFEFDAKDVDSYEFDLLFDYNSTVEQSIELSYWSGTLAPNTERYHVAASNVWIHFRLVVNTEPVIPSKEAIAEAVVLQVKQDLQDYMGEIRDLTDQFTQAIYTMVALIVGSIISSILALIVAFYAIRTAHQEGRR